MNITLNAVDAGNQVHAVETYTPRAVEFHPHGGQSDFVWLPARTTHRGCIVRVVSQTTSRKIPTRNVLPLCFVIRYMFDVRVLDTTDAFNGPNGKGCGDGKPTDAVPFDGAFACDCNSTRFLGDNCEVERPEPTAAAAGSSTHEANEAGQSIGGICGFAAVVAAFMAAVHLRRRRERNRPADFRKELDRLLEAGYIVRAEGAAPGAEGAEGMDLPREIARRNVSLLAKIGSGAFGEVWKGVLDDSGSGGAADYMVAVKTLVSETSEATAEMLEEAILMAHIGTYKSTARAVAYGAWVVVLVLLFMLVLLFVLMPITGRGWVSWCCCSCCSCCSC